MHRSRVSAGRERVSGAARRWVAAVRERRQDVRCATGRSRSRRAPPPSRRTPPAPPTSRCSATRSATTSTARSPPSPTARRWSTCATGRRWTYAELRRRGRRAGARPARRRASGRATGSASGRPNCAEWTLVQYATAKIGAILVNINPAYRTHELDYVLNQAGIALLVAARELQDRRLRGDDRPRSRPTARTLREVVLLGTPDWDALVAGGRARRPRASWRARQAELSRRRPDQHPVHVGHHRLPQGRDALATTTSSTTASSSASCCGYTEDDRVCIPVPFYHCFGMVMGNLGCDHARRDDGHPGARLRPGGDPAGRRSTSGAPRCTACRRCSSPSSTLPDFDVLRPVLAAHRDHGRLAVPGRGDEAGASTEMDMTEVTICYGMTETSPVSTQTRADDDLDRRVVHRRPGAPARRGQDRRPGDRPDRAARRAGRAVHPRLLGDARLLGRAGEDRRGDRRRRAGCTPATWR